MSEQSNAYKSPDVVCVDEDPDKKPGAFSMTLVELLVVIAIIGILVALLLPAVQMGGIDRRRLTCANNLKQIAIALHCYADEHGSLPPVVVRDQDGQALYSWRVLILPYMEHKPLYEEFHFDEPWDSPHNLEVARSIPHMYRCPESSQEFDDRGYPQDLSAHYVMVLDEEGMFFDTEARCWDDVAIPSDTLMVSEVEGVMDYWTQPKEITAAELFHRMSCDEECSHHDTGVNVALADGSVRFLSKSIRREDFDQLVSRDGLVPVKGSPSARVKATSKREMEAASPAVTPDRDRSSTPSPTP